MPSEGGRRFRRRMQWGDQTWAQDRRGRWFTWSDHAADWVPASGSPPVGLEPDPEAAEVGRFDQAPEDADMSFGAFVRRGPGRNLLIASAIFIAAMLLTWAVSPVFDPFGVEEQGVFYAFTDGLPYLAIIVAVPWIVINGIQRVRRGESFLPLRPGVSIRREVGRTLSKLLATTLTAFAITGFLAWSLGGFIGPFEVFIISIQPWENHPWVLLVTIVLTIAAAIAWTFELRHRR